MSKIKKIALLEEENKRLKENNRQMKNFMYNAVELVMTLSLKILLEMIVTMNKTK